MRLCIQIACSLVLAVCITWYVLDDAGLPPPANADSAWRVLMVTGERAWSDPAVVLACDDHSTRSLRGGPSACLTRSRQASLLALDKCEELGFHVATIFDYATVWYQHRSHFSCLQD